ncbi:MAG: hypothetical protein KA191_16715 [Verrucomicrobia bacterium]|nr:hypothetical protein [Verrucomicrobiota bacterium]OQC64333.1 MAG: hypothetical protein BWX48_02827 [Verrucomicrobia bacterium ADurb.Bin006]MDI9382589.1 hypothetical protein [Verrucomicrobiota bacterium]NMD21205.1 hypothetical protein [Verrucomicrobiota bacterium]HNU98994.1 hypothetical protein [Verrucomicrobiota bacterium]
MCKKPGPLRFASGRTDNSWLAEEAWIVFIPKSSDLCLPARATLAAGKVSVIQVRGLSDSASGRRVVAVPSQAANPFAAHNAGPSTALRLEVEFHPAS